MIEEEEIAVASYETAYNVLNRMCEVLVSEIQDVFEGVDTLDEAEFIRAIIESATQHIIDTRGYVKEKPTGKSKNKTGGSGKS